MLDQAAQGHGQAGDRPRERLEPHGHQAEEQRNREERNARPEVGSGDAPAPPPGIKQNHEREHDDGAFGEHRRKEPTEGPKIEEWSALSPTPRSERRRQSLTSALGTTRSHPHRQILSNKSSPAAKTAATACSSARRSRPPIPTMRGWMTKIQSSHPWPTQPQFPQKAPKQKPTEKMQCHICEVVSKNLASPQMPLHPLDRCLERIIVEGVRGQPDFRPTRSEVLAQRGIMW